MQYIEASKGSGDYDTLLRAIAGRVATAVDVRLIESAEYGMKWAEKMKQSVKQSGVHLTQNIRLQPNVHNKGFAVDARQVVISSQNFSPAGIQQNRDAGVIIASKAITAYYEAVLVADWETRAKPFAASPPIKARQSGKRTSQCLREPRLHVRERHVREAFDSLDE